MLLNKISLIWIFFKKKLEKLIRIGINLSNGYRKEKFLLLSIKVGRILFRTLTRRVSKNEVHGAESLWLPRTLIRGGYDHEELRRLVIISFAGSRFDSN